MPNHSNLQSSSHKHRHTQHHKQTNKKPNIPQNRYINLQFVYHASLAIIRDLYILSNHNQTMMIRKCLPLQKQFFFANRNSFSNEGNVEAVGQAKASKPYRMPVQKKIELYKTQFPIRMHNYRTLLFLNKQSLRTPMLLQCPHFFSFAALIFLIRNNPWYLIFPASLPIMMGLEIFIFARWIIHKRHFKYMIQRVYLMPGSKVQFLFSNKIRRRLKDIEDSHQFITADDLITPLQNPDGTRDWTQRGKPFPSELFYRKNKQTGEIQITPPEKPIRYGWTKHTSNFNPYIFPKQYEYANWQILVPLLNGREMDFQGYTNEQHELIAGEQYPSIEQQLEWIRQDQLKDEELRKERLKLTNV